ncbi:MAG: hypothetical protein R3F41_16520 [Gammaproteobacteria bacterium]|nr:hypothetical protein [Pseudomonadales bacterium]MCP5346625.1 hypothetical protein [Pseudomonadales bacterium]
MNLMESLIWYRARVFPVLAAALLSGPAVLPGSARGQAIALDQQVWNAEVIRPRGQPVVPLFDGWFPNQDGSRTLCYGYFNLNTEQSFDIPVGERNHLDRNALPALLPTHFEPLPPRYRRRFCVFTVTVPAGFGVDETVVWTLSSNGQTLSVPGHIRPAYILDEPRSDGRGDIAPLIRLDPDGDGVRGRNGIHSRQPLQVAVAEPLQLRAWIEHPDPRVWVGWSKHSGPGEVLFNMAESEVATGSEPATVIARFDQPGDYVIRLQTIDSVAAFEFFCCHSNAYFHVTVTD